ncbi:MAG: radical SAM protein [Candidatus Omnitrophica bacterium]|nr:radical SAM protein [Candidatus Omnitrophota bacterium]
MIDAFLIYPKLGSMDSMVRDIPLSIIYAAAHSVKRGYNVKAIDLRCENGNWKEKLKSYLDQGVLLAGVSVMTGSPLYYAREISLFIKENYPATKIVWGGPHVTILPQTIQEPFTDFLIRGYGSVSLAELIASLKSNSNYSNIKGLSYKREAGIFHNPRSHEHEMLHYLDIPYHLIDVSSPVYSRSYAGERMFPIFTSIGCPYHCSFCVHPAIYNEINGSKWCPYPEEEVVDHIKYIIKKFAVTHICFIDDTSFVDLERMRRIFEIICSQGVNVTLEFRGARINEIDRMDDAFFHLMIKAGGRFMMVGVESASDHVLKTMQKGITKEQILRVNQKLARFPELKPYYNFIYGTPHERYKDLVETKEAVLKMLSDNPQAYFGFGGDWKPIPGTKMLEVAEREYGFKTPQSLDDWIEIDSSDARAKIVHPWYSARHNNMIKLMQVTSFVIDDKIIKESSTNKTIGFKTLRLLSRLYKPIALFRLKFNFHQMLIEYSFWRIMLKLMPYLTNHNKHE